MSYKKTFITLVTIIIVSIAIFKWLYKNENDLKLNRSYHMRSIGITLGNYTDAYKQFPQPIFHVHPKNDLQSCNWRFRQVSYLGYGSGYPDEKATKNFDFEKNWDEEPNISLWIPEYCWSGKPQSTNDKERYWTNVMAITGPDTAFEIQSLDQLKGCDDHIIVVEVANSGIHWGQPGDIDINHLPDNLTSGIDGDGFMVLFFDGSVWFIKKEVPLDTLKHFFTATGARKHDREKELKPYAKVYFDSTKN